MALNAVAGLFQVTKHAWRHPARFTHALALSAVTQQNSLYHSTPQLSAAQPATAAEAIAAADAARRAANFEPYDQLAAKGNCPDGILTRGRDRFDGKKLGQFTGLLLRNEPAGTICRLRALLKDTTLESAIATAIVATLVHDTPSIKSSEAAHDSSSNNLMVFQTTQRQITAKGVRDIMTPGYNNYEVIDVDLFKIPKTLLAPLMDSTATAPAAVVGTGSNGSITQEILTAIQAGKSAGPYAAVGYAAVSSLIQEINAARTELLQNSSSSSSSNDMLCRVDRAPADSTAEYQRAALAATVEGRDPPKYVYLITIYPCPWWPETPRLDRVAAVAAAAAAVA